ncbi:ABC transporter permease subunit [Allorhizocola rhizosphaerae]|uniref:ABC transporter permease subunit n=1 Tax=Allorhizocola rhizosphaerae TaxID=1872709 RepID=UPI000E3BC705|nr:ABC transporter permease subunit [Allorhizocola rhizosphaerae]
MVAAFLSEMVKLRQRTYWLMAAVMVAFMAITMVMSISGAGDAPSDRGPAGLVLALQQLQASDGLGRSLGNAATFLGIVAVTLIALNVGGEYDHGTLRNLLVRQPRRIRLLGGKTAALMSFLAGTTIVTGLAGVGMAHLLASNVDTTAWQTRDGLTATTAGVAGLTAAVLGWASLGVLAGILLRSAAIAIGAAVAYALPVEILLTVVAGDVARWLPGQLFQALARGGTPDVNPTTALLGSAAWATAAMLLAALIFRHRDVTN